MILFNSKSGATAFLSNLYPCVFVVDGKEYRSAEHYFQSEKYRLAGHGAWADAVRAAPTPAAAKSRGGPRLKHADKPELSAEWLRHWNDGVRVDVMKRALAAKFRDPDLAARLRATGDEELVEDMPDGFWGRGRKRSADGTFSGANITGQLLMQVLRGVLLLSS